MSTVLMVTSEMAGRIQICCEVGKQLQAAGHQVMIGSPAPIRDRVTAAGLRFVDVEAPRPPDSDRPGKPGVVGRLRGLLMRLGTITTIAQRRAARAALLGVDEFVAVMQSTKPDLVLIDLELGAHHLVASSLGIPTAGWTSMMSVWKRPGLPPLGSDILPGRGLRGSRLGIELAWLGFRARRWISDLRLRITRIGEDRMSVLRHVARRLGVSPAEVIDPWQWLVPFVPRVPALVFNLLDLDYPHIPGPGIRYVGPMLGSPSAQDDPLLAELSEARAAGTADALLYASFGAWDKGDDDEFVRRIIEMGRLRPTWTIVVGLGGRRDPADFGEVPANVRLRSWAPQQAILELVDCAIHHGGISSINECVRAEVPMVVYPFDFLDQPGNAARVEFHGLGIRGDRRTDTPADIAGRVEQALTGSFADNLADASRSVRELERNRAAVSAVNDILRDRPGPPKG